MMESNKIIMQSTNQIKRVFQVPAPLSILDLDPHHQLNSTSRSTKHILQKRVSLGSSNSLAASQNASSGGISLHNKVKSNQIKTLSNGDILVKRIQSKIMGDKGEIKKSRERTPLSATTAANNTISNASSYRLTLTQKSITTNSIMPNMTSPQKQPIQPLLKSFQWQNVSTKVKQNLSNQRNKHDIRKNSMQIIFSKAEQPETGTSKKEDATSIEGRLQQNIEMIKKKPSHKRLATVSSQGQASTGNNNPPFSKNLILSQLVQNSNYQTASKQANGS